MFTTLKSCLHELDNPTVYTVTNQIAQSQDCAKTVRNLEIAVHYKDSENALRNSKIVRNTFTAMQ